MSDMATKAAPLDEVMMAMDVVDTLRHQSDLVDRELSATNREAQLIARLKAIYSDQGIEVPDHILKEGVKALDESRFTYNPPEKSWKTSLAHLYVTRGAWGKPVIAVFAALILVIGGYNLIYKPMVAGQVEAQRVELAETLPAKLEAAYQAIYADSKVQSPIETAQVYLERGKTSAARGDSEGAKTALTQLNDLHKQIASEYSLRIVNRDGESTGVWRFPEVNSDATNYYIVVEAIGPDGKVLNLPILSEETNQTETVPVFAVRVPEMTYNSVREDRLDDGIIQRDILGVKQYGFPDINYVLPATGGMITRW